MSIRLGLERLSKYFINTNPNKVFPNSILPNTIHVGGTNGKGSICKLIQDIILQDKINNKQKLIKIGKFTSPFTVTPNDSITINNIPIPLSQYNKALTFNYAMNTDEEKLSPFEETTIKAIKYFKNNNTDLNIMEVGCGGLQDSTNIIPFEDKILIIINKISLDHTNLLGDTLKQIAEQKAGIINGFNNTKCQVLINNDNDKEQVIDTIVAKCKDADINYKIIDTSDSKKLNNSVLSDFIEKNYKNNYQYGNIIMALNGIKHLEEIKVITPVDTKSIVKTLDNFELLGRLTKINDFPLSNKNNTLPLLIDGSHNNDALENLGKYIDYNFRNSYSDAMIFIISKTNSKNLKWSNIIRKNDIVIITEFKDIEEMKWIRSSSADEIYQELLLEGVFMKNILIEKDINVAISIANINKGLIFNSKKPEYNIVVVGSLYLAGKVFKIYQDKKNRLHKDYIKNV